MTHDKPEPPDMRGDGQSYRRLVYDLHVELARLRTMEEQHGAACLWSYDRTIYNKYLDAAAAVRTLKWVLRRLHELPE